MKTRRITLIACAAALAALLGGCGEIKNTITPAAGTATHLTLELAGPPNALYAGVYDALALGYYKQSDIKLTIKVPATGVDPLDVVHNYQADVAVSSEPNVLLRRNQNVPVVSVGAIVQVPLSSVKIKVPKHKTATAKHQKGSKHGATSTKTTSSTHTSTTLQEIWAPGAVGAAGATVNSNLTTPKDARKLLESPDAPPYQGLVFVVRKPTIVSHATSPNIRRFLQTTARGYEAARQDPQQAVTNLIQLNPSLRPDRAELMAQLTAFLPHMFPSIPTVGSEKGKPQGWGFSNSTEWNQFGDWLYRNKLITDPNAILDASTNELLAGKGI